MAKQESEILNRVRVKCSEVGIVTFRNNSGSAWQGKSELTRMTRMGRLEPGDVIIRQATFVKYGIANPGGSDLIGWRPVVITPDMVGHKLAVFTALEVKTATGHVEAEQQAFIDSVNQSGGMGQIVRSIDDIELAIRKRV